MALKSDKGINMAGIGECMRPPGDRLFAAPEEEIIDCEVHDGVVKKKQRCTITCDANDGRNEVRRFRSDLNLWELACGGGSAASQESAILVYGYLTGVGLISIVSTHFALGFGIFFSFIPAYHWNVTEKTKSGVCKRAGLIILATTEDVGRFLYDTSLQNFRDINVEVCSASGCLANLIVSYVNRTLINSADCFEVYKKMLAECIPEFEIVDAGSRYTGKGPSKAYAIRHCGDDGILGMHHIRCGKKIEWSRNLATASGIEAKEARKQGIKRWKQILVLHSGMTFHGSNRMELMHKILNGHSMTANDTYTLLHDWSLVMGVNAVVCGIGFNGITERDLRLDALKWSFDVGEWMMRATKERILVCNTKNKQLL